MTLLLLLACAPAEPEGGAPYAVTLTTDPDPLLTGAALLVVDAPHATSLRIDAEMVGMDHGFPAEPTITGSDGGWEAAVDFTMSGTWELTFLLDGEAGEAAVVRSVDVR